MKLGFSQSISTQICFLALKLAKKYDQIHFEFRAWNRRAKETSVRERVVCLFVYTGVMKVHRVGNSVRKITKVSLVLGVDFLETKHCFREIIAASIAHSPLFDHRCALG